MTAPVSLLLAFIGLVVSAKTRLNAVLFGQHVSIPWLGLLFTVLILALVALILHLIRLIARDGLRQKPVRATRDRYAT